MNRRLLALLLVGLALVSLLCGCGAPAQNRSAVPEDTLQLIEDSEESLQLIEETAETSAVPSPEENAPAEETPVASEIRVESELASDEESASMQSVSQEAEISEDGEYTAPEDVALYLHTYGHLPGNYITKNEARDLGWDSSKGNLWDVAPGKSIGGDRFGNYEGLLPDGKYKECDVNYDGGYRDAERLIYGEDGSVYYTNDHYKSFTQLY